MGLRKTLVGIFVMSMILPIVSSAHYIVGIVEDAKDGTLANGHTVVMWNPTNGQQDNLTDIVGPTGNSGADNIYMMDCEMLSTPCQIGDNLTLKVVDNGDNYLSGEVNVTVQGMGYDLVNNISINSPPNFQEINLDDPQPTPVNEIDLIPATTQQVTCSAKITEYEGEGSLISASAEIFDSDVSFYGDSDDNNYHYSNNSCYINQSYGNSNEVEVLCGFEMWYYSNSNNWTCQVKAQDNFSTSSNSTGESFINPLLALNVDSPIDFGEFNLEEVSDEIEVEIINYGNVEMNLSLSGYAISEGDGYAMNCSGGIIGLIPVTYEKFNLSESISGTLNITEFEETYSNLTSSPEVKNFNLNFRQNDLANDAMKSTYWRIYVPQGISGNCQGNIIFGAAMAPGE